MPPPSSAPIAQGISRCWGPKRAAEGCCIRGPPPKRAAPPSIGPHLHREGCPRFVAVKWLLGKLTTMQASFFYYSINLWRKTKSWTLNFECFGCCSVSHFICSFKTWWLAEPISIQSRRRPSWPPYIIARPAAKRHRLLQRGTVCQRGAHPAYIATNGRRRPSQPRGPKVGRRRKVKKISWQKNFFNPIRPGLFEVLSPPGISAVGP